VGSWAVEAVKKWKREERLRNPLRGFEQGMTTEVN
jgi:hypothetical protein